MAYGHREGQLRRHRTHAPPQAARRARFRRSRRYEIPGKTLPTAAVKQAAEALKYTEDKATVI
jgi:Ca-activated chloride channel family protein